MPAPRRGSRTAPEVPGRAGPRRAAPAQTASVRPSSPAASGPAQTWGASWGSAARDAPLAPHTRPQPQTLTQSPCGAAGTWSVGHPGAAPAPSRPLGCPLPRPTAALRQRLPRAAAAAPAPATDGRRSRRRLFLRDRGSLAPPPPSRCHSGAEGRGRTCWDGSPGGGSSKSIMLSWGPCVRLPDGGPVRAAQARRGPGGTDGGGSCGLPGTRFFATRP